MKLLETLFDDFIVMKYLNLLNLKTLKYEKVILSIVNLRKKGEDIPRLLAHMLLYYILLLCH
jgi:hypothetical protein